MTIKRKAKKSKKELGFEGYTQVLLEDLHSKFDVFGEGLIGVKDEFTGVKDELSEVRKKGDATFEEVGHLRVDMEFVKDELRLIRNELKEKVDRDEFKTLETRVAYIEKRLRAA